MLQSYKSKLQSKLFIRVVLLWCVGAGGGDGGQSEVSRIGARVPHHQRNPQHATEWRRGVAKLKDGLPLNCPFDGPVRTAAGLIWSRGTENCPYLFALGVNMTVIWGILQQRNILKKITDVVFICIYFCNSFVSVILFFSQ